jgi:hypothetical protein
MLPNQNLNLEDEYQKGLEDVPQENLCACLIVKKKGNRFP